jgi:superfamily II DNA/RNA helicase
MRKRTTLSVLFSRIVAGSGKTAAFLIPLIEKLGSHSAVDGTRAIVLSPTRELAIQTLKFARQVAHFTDLRCSLIVGGDSMEQQVLIPSVSASVRLPLS